MTDFNLPRRAMWILIALLVGETTLQYIDRQVLSVLAPTLRDEFHLSNGDYASIVNAFLIAYACSYALSGRVLDRVGVTRGLPIAVGLWSAIGGLTAFASGPGMLRIFRACLALPESAAWPAFAKATATWIPAKMRALVIGLCNSGSSLGAAIAPPLVAFLAVRWGWRGAFATTGLFGIVWVAAFLLFRRAYPVLESMERPVESKAGKGSWISLLRYRQVWAIFVCRLLADMLWYFMVAWIPEFLTRERHLGLAEIGAVAWIPFAVSDAANFISGYVSMRLERAGWSANRTRKTLMVSAALLSPIGALAPYAPSLTQTVALLSVTVFIWTFWSVSVHSLAGDYFPKQWVGSAYAIGGTGSTLGSVISTWAVGRTLDVTHSYTPVIVAIALVMPVAMACGMPLMGRVEPITIEDPR